MRTTSTTCTPAISLPISTELGSWTPPAPDWNMLVESLSTVTVLLSLMLTIGCGYFKGGAWEDDPKNFQRAWGMSPPEGLRVLHSWYFRSAHFTREEVYYFEIVGIQEFAEDFAEVNGMVLAEPESLERFSFCVERPSWFAPKDPEHYRIWTSRQPSGIVLQEKVGDRSFIYVCQL